MSAIREIPVAMGMAVASPSREDVLVIHGLGSCIGLALYDPQTGAGCLCHIVLPSSGQAGPAAPAKFADRAVPYAIKAMEALGCPRHRLQAKVVGGANVLRQPLNQGLASIGVRNVEEVLAQLSRARIPVVGKDVGGQTGRTMRFFLADGRIEVWVAGGHVLTL